MVSYLVSYNLDLVAVNTTKQIDAVCLLATVVVDGITQLV